MMEGLGKQKETPPGNAFRKMMLDNIGRKRVSGEPFSKFEKVFIEEEEKRKLEETLAGIKERAQERHEGHGP
ncbi:hypothetical protein HZA26_03585 [Candidatus Nomurabacteria bacterium]|nr:hypothetical protein [Candidatus Nomurabacteria bacterium]